MKSELLAPTKYITPLRQAQRELTRSRIKNAARNLFYEKHYDTTTMDDIAGAAGLRRSTVYLHYKDKAEILLDIIAEYTPKAKAVLATLPGPAPSADDLHRWVKRVAKFVAKERAPLSIIREEQARRQDDNAFEEISIELLCAIGTNNPLFVEATKANASPMLRARAQMLLEELTYACGTFAQDSRAVRAEALLRVVVEDFHRFLSS